MKKIILIFSLIFCYFFSVGQPPQVVRSTNSTIPVDYNIFTKNRLKVPVFPDTTSAIITPDSLGLIIYTKTPKAFWYRDSVVGGGHKWTNASTGGSGGIFVDTGYARNDTLFLYKNGAEFVQALPKVFVFHNPLYADTTVHGADTIDVYTDNSWFIDSITGVRDSILYLYTVNNVDTSNKRIRGLYVTWLHDLVFGISSGAYQIGSDPIYYFEGDSVDLAPGPVTDPRRDLIGVNSNNDAFHEDGIENSDPSPPLPDPATQLALTDVLLNVGDTTPAGVTIISIYDQHRGPPEEWTPIAQSGLTANFDDIVTVYHLDTAASIGSWTVNKTVTFTSSTTVDRNAQTLLRFFIKLNSPLPTAANILLRFRNGSTNVTNAITLTSSYGFIKASTAWQLVVVPLSSIAFTGSTFDAIQFIATASSGVGGAGFHLDWIQLQGGVNNGTSGNYLTNVYISNDSLYQTLQGQNIFVGLVNQGSGGSGISEVVAGLGLANTNDSTIYLDTASAVVLSRQRAAATYALLATTITINGVTFDLSANRTWSVGTVTSIATNTATGLFGGTITGSGTLYIDTTIISTRAWRDKLADSLGALIATKLTSTLADGKIWVGNASNVATAVTPTGDVTITNAGVTAIGTNKVLDAMIRQSAGLSVIGRSANTTGDVADITAGSDYNILRRSGTAVGFGSIDLSQSGAVGSSVLPIANGGTNNGSLSVTNGGLAYFDGTKMVALPIGTAAQHLVVVGGIPAWRDTAANGGGITTLNTLTGATQTFATGTAGSDFGISSSGTTHTFNLPTASASNRGALSTTDWSTFNNKMTNPMTTRGDIITAATSGTPQRLALGGLGSVLTSDGTDAVWTTFIPYVRYIAASKSAVAADGGNGGTGTNGGSNASAYNFFIGANSGYKITSGINNIGLGQNTLDSITTAEGNIAIGGNALAKVISPTTGNNSGALAIGYNSQTVTTSPAIANVSIGRNSLAANTTGQANTAIGLRTMETGTTASFNTAIGTTALNVTTGDFNVAIGYQSMVANTSGAGNVVIGYQASNAATVGANNTSIGRQSTTGDGGANVALGYQSVVAGGSSNVVIRSKTTGAGDRNILIGTTVQDPNVSTGITNIVIGDQAKASSATSNNQISIGNAFNRNSTAQFVFDGTANEVTAAPTFTASVGFDFLSTNRGLRLPRQTSAQRTAISSPADYIKVTDTDKKGDYQYRTSTAGWQPIAYGQILADNTADANNTGTGETDLYSYTTVASQLANTGEKLIAIYAGTFNDITATGQLQIYFAGTNIGNTGALTISATGGWEISVIIIRTGSSTARASVSVTTPGASTAVYTTESDLTGLTFTNTNILKITGTAGGAGGGNSDITAKLGTVEWKPAAQ